MLFFEHFLGFWGFEGAGAPAIRAHIPAKRAHIPANGRILFFCSKLVLKHPNLSIFPLGALESNTSWLHGRV